MNRKQALEKISKKNEEIKASKEAFLNDIKAFFDIDDLHDRWNAWKETARTDGEMLISLSELKKHKNTYKLVGSTSWFAKNVQVNLLFWSNSLFPLVENPNADELLKAIGKKDGLEKVLTQFEAADEMIKGNFYGFYNSDTL